MELSIDVEKMVAEEVRRYLEPYLEKMVRDYILLDRKAAFDELCVSRSFFDENIKKKPQVRLAERHFEGSDKVFYEPSELRKAVLSITKF